MVMVMVRCSLPIKFFVLLVFIGGVENPKNIEFGVYVYLCVKNVKLYNYWLIGLDDMIKNLIEEIENQLWNLRWLAMGRGFRDLKIW